MWPDDQHNGQHHNQVHALQPVPGEPFLELNDLLLQGDIEIQEEVIFVEEEEEEEHGMNLDLNQPPPDDLGDLDVNWDLVDHMIQDVHMEQEPEGDVIVASSDSSGEDEPPAGFFEQPVEGSLHFVMPPVCPVLKSPSCLTSSGEDAISLVEAATSAEFHNAVEDEQAEEDEHAEEESTLNAVASIENESILKASDSAEDSWAKSLLIKAGKAKLTDDSPTLRRSSRQKAGKNGFRHKTCHDKHCIACEIHPP